MEFSETLKKDVIQAWFDHTMYNNDTFPRCKGTGVEAGFSKEKAGTQAAWAGYMKNYVEYDGVYYIARQINKNGAEFCKTIVSGKRSGCTTHLVTLYFDPGVKDCFWLCKKDFYGEGCCGSESDSGNCVNNATNYSQSPSEYAAKKTGAGTVALQGGLPKGGSVENAMDFFYEDLMLHCDTKSSVGNDWSNFSSNKSQEHDVVLAIYEIKADGDSVIFDVRPMIVRAGGTAGCNRAASDAWPMISWIGGTSSHLLCPSDYGRVGDECVHPLAVQSTQQKNDTEEINNTYLGSLCYGYKKEGYDEAQHSFVVVNSQNTAEKTKQPGDDGFAWGANMCTKYVCRSSVMGFASDWKTSGNMKCETCTGEPMRYGVDTDGACITCVNGEIFDSNTKKCEKARVFSKNDMRFGVGNAPSADLEKQCWTKDNPTDYKNCILGVTTVENVGSVKEETFENEMISQLENKTFENVGSVKENEMISQLLKNKTFKKEMISPLENKAIEMKMMSQDVK